MELTPLNPGDLFVLARLQAGDPPKAGFEHLRSLEAARLIFRTERENRDLTTRWHLTVRGELNLDHHHSQGLRVLHLPS